MALAPPFLVRVEKQPGDTFGGTMHNIRSWLDHRHIQPASFNPVTSTQSGVRFEIGFNSENEAQLFERDFCLTPATGNTGPIYLAIERALWAIGPALILLILFGRPAMLG